MTKLLVIDLDQTTIDSSIRENYCYKNNVLDLAKYHQVKSCHHNGIVNDTLTPFGRWLSENYHSLLENGYTIVFLTARLCDYQDFKAFKRLGIEKMLLQDCLTIERGACALYGGNEKEQDSGKYKKPICHYLARAYNTYDICVIDDCIKVLDMAKTQGFRTICARELYHYKPSDFAKLFY